MPNDTPLFWPITTIGMILFFCFACGGVGPLADIADSLQDIARNTDSIQEDTNDIKRQLERMSGGECH
jgi:hypothetical protein